MEITLTAEWKVNPDGEPQEEVLRLGGLLAIVHQAGSHPDVGDLYEWHLYLDREEKPNYIRSNDGSFVDSSDAKEDAERHVAGYLQGTMRGGNPKHYWPRYPTESWTEPWTWSSSGLDLK